LQGALLRSGWMAFSSQDKDGWPSAVVQRCSMTLG
jgi:hypothetical protein